MLSPSSEQHLQGRLLPLLELLQKQQILEFLSSQEEGLRTSQLAESLTHRQHEEVIRRKIKEINAPDLAHLLEMLPLQQRKLVWELTEDQTAADALVELNDAVLTSLIQMSSRDRLKQVLGLLHIDDLPELADFLPQSLLQDVKQGLEEKERQWLEQTLTYHDDQVGNLMGHESLMIAEGTTVDEAIEQIRQRSSLPDQSDKIFVIKGQATLVGVLPLTELLRHDGQSRLEDVMETEVVTFNAQEEAESAAYAFERYDLISAPVVDERNRIVGRLTVEAMMDFLRERREEQDLGSQGLSTRADLFAPVWVNARARWFWLGLNLITAFTATRFISLFEHAIEELVALAALMPIVASVGGNTGQQTAAMMIRSLTLGQLHRDNLKIAFGKELGVSLLNGLIWGSIVGVLVILLYGSTGLGMVMATAILLNLLVAAVVGLVTPLTIDRLGKDPAMGTSVILTFLTDSMGFFLFLGLATLWLL